MRFRLLSALLFILYFVGTAQAEPGLSVPANLNVGGVEIGSSRDFDFPVTNTSPGVLRVMAIHSTCSCTQVQFEGDTTLQPGAERKVSCQVSFSPPIGEYMAKVVLTVRDAAGNDSITVIPIRGIAVAPLVLEKPVVDFGTIDLRAGVQTAECGIERGNSTDIWDSLQAFAESRNLSITTERSDTRNFRVIIHLDPGTLPIGTYRDRIKIQMLDAGQPVKSPVDLPVVASIEGPFKVTPASVFIGSVPPNSKVERSLLLSSSGSDLQNLIVERKPSDTEADITWVSDGLAKLTVKVSPAQTSGVLTEMLVILNKTTGTRLKIPILGIIRT